MRMQVAYDVQVDAMYAGTSVVVHVATTAHVANFSVFIRVDGWPTASLFDYSFDASQGRPIGALGTATDPIDPSVQSFEALRQQPNSTTTTAPSFLEFPPIVFPKIGHWYIIVAPTVPSTPSQREWGVAIQLQTNACPPRNVCSNHGTCLVKTSYQGIVYGECQCAYGYGGRDCSLLVYTPREVLEAVLFVALGVISGVYHACDLNLYCLFPYAFLQSMDFTFTFNAIMLGFIHLSGAFKHAKAGMQVFVLVALVFMTTYNATSMKNWIVLGGVITVQFVATWSYYIHSIWHCTAMLAAFAFMGFRKNIRYRCVGEDGVDVLSHEATQAAARLDNPPFKPHDVVLMREDVEESTATTQVTSTRTSALKLT
ncbi:hypothetical protein DYB32_010784 [Aphanomyces invadans]|uniref:EGF-like domain-containing protein n=1 Tax=Aphanomyces invadans TaxID=157072 RepID=A0A418AF55_9STRA|nr:hypothetical protein DYB32_010784 [Aphanomyces invadans]